MNESLYSQSLIISLPLMLFFGLHMLFGRTPEKKVFANYLLSRRLMGVALIILAANYSVHLFYSIRTKDVNATILMNLITVSRVQRNPTVKTEIKMRNFEANIPLGFFCYPVSQAADITLFKATTVPAGEDQEPMLEVTRELVRRFNQTYAPVLVEPEIMLPENATARRLPGTDGKEKMSKSLGNCIYLSDSEKEVWKKVKKMSNGAPRMSMDEPGNLEGNAVFTYLEAFSCDDDFANYWPEFKNLDELKEHYVHGGIGDGTCKKFLNTILNNMLEPMRQRRHELEQDIPEIYNILRKGTEKARETAAQTMAEVREAMRINYFDDAELIRSQAERFKSI